MKTRTKAPVAQPTNVAAPCYSCQKPTTPESGLCRVCLEAVKALCASQEVPINKMLVDAIWNVRADRRGTLVKKVTTKLFNEAQPLKEANTELRKQIKSLRAQNSFLVRARDARKRNKFKLQAHSEKPRKSCN